MANLTHTGTALTPINFATRVQLVAEEITRRKSEANPANATAFTARLWVRWIRKNILNLPTGKGYAA